MIEKRTCENCQANDLDFTDTFCKHCGIKLNRIIKEENISQKASTPSNYIVLLFFFIIFFACCWFFMFQPNKSRNNVVINSENIKSKDIFILESSKNSYNLNQNRVCSNSIKIANCLDILSKLNSISSFSSDLTKCEIASFSQEVASRCEELKIELIKEEEEAKKNAELVKMKQEEEKIQKQKLLNDLLKKFNINEDKLERITFYTHKNFPKYTSDKSCAYLYVVKDKQSWVRAKIQYVTQNHRWLFARYVTFYIDGVKIEKNFEYSDWKRDNGHGSLWEWVDLYGGGEKNEWVELFKKIEKSKETTVRIYGEKYYSDVIISDKEKTGIKESFELVELLNSK